MKSPANENGNHYVIVIDDDEDFASTIVTALKRIGLNCSKALPSRESLSRGSDWDCDLVITDVIMPDYDGLEVIRAIRGHHPGLPIIAMSGGGDYMSADLNLRLCKTLGAIQVLHKPFDAESLIAAVRLALTSPRSATIC